MARILEKSSILKELNDAEKIAVVGGVYQLDSGQVIWLD
jgi:carbonic anhydrase